jgi:glycerate-2-kinase
VVIFTLGTDGIDGPTEAAGAVVDGFTIKRAQKHGLKAGTYLEDNDSNSFFKQLNDIVLTGPTGTNVNDLILILAR